MHARLVSCARPPLPAALWLAPLHLPRRSSRAAAASRNLTSHTRLTTYVAAASAYARTAEADTHTAALLLHA